MKKTVLIVKLGYCETLVNEEGFTPSLGDVFRHTVLLHHYADYQVSWLTSEAAGPLLKGNPLIHELLIYHRGSGRDLASRHFDEVLCLEKAPTICRLVATVKAGRYFGFGRAGRTTRAHPGAESAVEIANGKEHFLPIQALLFQMVGAYWKGEDYVLGYRPRRSARFDVGLNVHVGKKWSSKAWPMGHWKELADRCVADGWTVSWQEGAGDLETYMDWINACSVVVTGDSLGMHLGLALRKRVIALFGPTPSEQIHMYGRGFIIRADWACPLAPCMLGHCARGEVCMSAITVDSVARMIATQCGTSTRPEVEFIERAHAGRVAA